MRAVSVPKAVSRPIGTPKVVFLYVNPCKEVKFMVTG